MYAALNKALVIDPSGELRDFLRFCAGRLWPKLEIVSYRWARGCPDETFDWTGFDLVVLEERLHVPGDRGVNWLRALRRNSAVPSIVLVAQEVTEKLRKEAERAGAAGVFNKDDLSPRGFAECVDRALRGPVEEPAPAPGPGPAPAAELADFAAVAARGSIAPVEVAAQVPGFHILRLLATTSRGWVSLATQESDRRTVILKTTRMTGEPASSTLRRFTREYTVLAQLADENVIRVFGHGFAQNCGFVASEYCQGGHLGKRIERGMPTSNAVDYLGQIMRGLGAVHAHGILHRDIKPTNLLFREDGTLVLTDLATERELSDNPRLTTKSLVGDLNYVSPESIRRGTVDLRSDLYSAGVVFYQMLTGTTPFGGATVTAMLEAHLRAPIPRLPSSCAALQPLVDGLLAKDPNERFQSAADVLDGIEWLCVASD
jgi:eukaryotic-like serine/threonine-protein kinase